MLMATPKLVGWVGVAITVEPLIDPGDKPGAGADDEARHYL
jgi:hypothetical protein